MAAETHLANRTPGRAIEVLEEARAAVAASGFRFWEPEVLRLRAAASLATGEPPAKVRTWLDESLRIARRQKAKALELRTALAICRLGTEGDWAEGRRLLAELYEGFAEGCETTELKEAEELLALLPA